MNTLRTINLKKLTRDLDENTKVISGIDLSVKKGEFVSIIYKTDKEKEILMDILSGFDTDIQGIIYIDNEDISLMNYDKLVDFRKKKIGFIFSDYNIIPSISVYENITLQLKLNNLKIDNEFIYDIVEIFGLVTKIHTNIKKLEVYEKIIVALAGVIAMNPSIVLVDNVIKELDFYSTYEIMRVFDIASKCFNKSIIMLSDCSKKLSFVHKTIYINKDRKDVQKLKK